MFDTVKRHPELVLLLEQVRQRAVALELLAIGVIAIELEGGEGNVSMLLLDRALADLANGGEEILRLGRIDLVGPDAAADLHGEQIGRPHASLVAHFLMCLRDLDIEPERLGRQPYSCDAQVLAAAR